MANVIIKSESRKEDVAYIAEKYGIDTGNPEMREAAEITAVRSREALSEGEKNRRYY